MNAHNNTFINKNNDKSLNISLLIFLGAGIVVRVPGKPRTHVLIFKRFPTVFHNALLGFQINRDFINVGDKF